MQVWLIQFNKVNDVVNTSFIPPLIRKQIKMFLTFITCSVQY